MSEGKRFASAGDLEEKKVTVTQLAERCYAYTAEGDPNSGFVVGDEGVLVIEAQATPVMAADVLRRVREVTATPVTHLFLTHYHAVRVLGASAYAGAEIIASEPTEELIKERGEQDYASELARFPRLFRAAESIPGLTWPTRTFSDPVTIDLGGVSVELSHPGRGHTQGDSIAWVADGQVLYAGDLVEHGATPYCGDAHLADWPGTLARLRAMAPAAVVPGRGDALRDAAAVAAGLDGTEAFVTDLLAAARAAVDAGQSLGAAYPAIHAKLAASYGEWVIFEHCMPFNASRAFDEAAGITHPRIWTAERDRQMWEELSGS